MRDTELVDKYIYYALCGFALLSCISRLGMNTFLTVLILLLLWRTYLDRTIWKNLLRIDKELVYPMLLVVGSALLSVLFSYDLKAGMHSFVKMYLHQMVPMLAVLVAVRDRGRLLTVASWLLLSVTFNNLWELKEVCAAALKLKQDFWRNFFTYMRFSGRFDEVMVQASVLAAAIPVFFAATVLSKEKKQRMLMGAGGIIALAALLFNSTRGAWLATAVTLLIVTALGSLRNKRLLFVCLITAVIIGGVVYTNTGLQKRIASIANTTTFSSNVERIYMWRCAWEMAVDHPLVGVGMGAYEKYFDENYQNLQLTKRRIANCHAHNNFFQMIAEQGFPGGLAYILLCVGFVWHSAKKWRTTGSVYWLYFFGIFTAIMIDGLTEYNIGHHVFAKIFWLALALGYALAKTEEKE